jgi:lysine 2,3-aminomutase
MAPRSIEIRTLAQLERLSGRRVPAADREATRQVLERYPVRLTSHLLELVRRSPAVAAQFLPDPREVGSARGEKNCFVGLVPTGAPGVERMYPDRCILMPLSACPAYCRFCERKHHSQRRRRPLSHTQLDLALSYVARHPELREVLITGGEPVLDLGRLEHLLRGLRRLAHVGPIRVACRAAVTDPGRLGPPLVELLSTHQDLRAGRPVELAVHVNHADEITPPTVEALARLREAGIHVYNQTVLLRGINTDPQALQELLWQLRSHGVETYTLYFGSPVLSTDHLRPAIDEALALKEHLRRQASGRANPHLILTTRLGKLELGVDGWVVEREADGRHVWVRTPYTLAGFRRMSPGFQLPAGAREDSDGRLVVRYLDGPALQAARGPGRRAAAGQRRS